MFHNSRSSAQKSLPILTIDIGLCQIPKEKYLVSSPSPKARYIDACSEELTGLGSRHGGLQSAAYESTSNRETESGQHAEGTECRRIIRGF